MIFFFFLAFFGSFVNKSTSVFKSIFLMAGFYDIDGEIGDSCMI